MKEVSIFYIIIHLLLWLSVLFFIFANWIYKQNNDLWISSVYFLIIFYISYIIPCFFPNNWSSLIKWESKKLTKHLKQMIDSVPKITYSVSCYHFENLYSKDNKGNQTSQFEVVRVDTHAETREFKYKSARDMSIQLTTEINKIKNDSNIYYIKLIQNLIINPSNDGTDSDYEKEKKLFLESNQNRDENMDIFEDKTIPEFKECEFVCNGDKKPFFLNCFWFFLSTLIGMNFLFKYYVKSHCIELKISFHKEYSSNRNLSEFATEIINIGGHLVFSPIASSQNDIPKDILITDPPEPSFTFNQLNKIPSMMTFRGDSKPESDIKTHCSINQITNANLQIDNDIKQSLLEKGY